MKAFLCNHCGRSSAAGEMILVPPGWYQLDHTVAPGKYETFHFDRIECLLAHVAQSRTQIDPVASAARSTEDAAHA